MTLRIYYNSEYLREIETLYENTSALDYLIMGPNGWEQWKTEGKKSHDSVSLKVVYLYRLNKKLQIVLQLEGSDCSDWSPGGIILG